MRRTDARVEHLRSVPMLRAFSKAELQLVVKLADEVPVTAGEVLVREGQRGHEFYVLTAGKADVTRDGRQLAVLGAGDFFGELAVLDPQPRTATVTMAVDGEVLVVSEREFYRLLDEVPTLSRKLLVGLARRLHEVDAAVVR